MKNETRSTPETDALIEKMSDEGLDIYDREDELKDYAFKLERKRDELREELARLQNMAASVADVVAKREAMLDAIREAHDALSTALRQWVLYAEERADEDLESAKHAEGQLYRLGQSALAKLKPFLP